MHFRFGAYFTLFKNCFLLLDKYYLKMAFGCIKFGLLKTKKFYLIITINKLRKATNNLLLK